ncbi:hypothetical protein RRG08_019204 [Elysia crispata]|uniref:Uncharacterized protein n=1 Tax=Elysia crispata TaxID=231223 RepID=A0AAE1AUG6_9GAST|nr:hypothetical protein RRG08_019204 [Elysia crispata]
MAISTEENLVFVFSTFKTSNFNRIYLIWMRKLVAGLSRETVATLVTSGQREINQFYQVNVVTTEPVIRGLSKSAN